MGSPRNAVKTSSVSPRMKTLVYHAGALGDFISMLPAIGAWRRLRPNHDVILLGKPAFGEVGVQSGYFDDVWDVERASWAWLFAPGAGCPAYAVDWFSGITSALLFTAAHGALALRLHALGVSEVLAHNPLPSHRVPIVRHYLSLLVQSEPGIADCGPHLNASQSFASGAQTLLQGVRGAVALHAGSGSIRKNWPLENFQALSAHLQNRGFPVIWLSGPAEGRINAPSGCLSVKNAALPTLIHIFKQCRAYIGNDSGISHCAAAVGLPSLVLFGPSDPVVWKPFGDHVHQVIAPGGCTPCHMNRVEREDCADWCMKRISVDEVISAFDRLFKLHY